MFLDHVDSSTVGVSEETNTEDPIVREVVRKVMLRDLVLRILGLLE
jgi:hypothetical protein